MIPASSDIFSKGSIALKGYDAVAYFTLDRAVQGDSQFTYEWNGKTWYFISANHRDLFEDSPDQYAPQFDGFCAFGVSNGYKASTRPEAFTIIDGKLYLNFAKYVKHRWMEKSSHHIASAKVKWDTVKHEKPIRARPIPIWWKYQFLKLFGIDLFK